MRTFATIVLAAAAVVGATDGRRWRRGPLHGILLMIARAARLTRR
jgi:hypothetical protein